MNVLYLEDNAQDADLVRIELRKRAPDIKLDVVCTLAEAVSRLEAFHEIYGSSPQSAAARPSSPPTADFDICPHYDLVLTDLNLPDGSGNTLLAWVRGKHLSLPVVMITGSADEEMLLSLLRAGADDYVIKRDNFEEKLPLVLRAAFDKFHTETRRRAASLRILYIEPNTRDSQLATKELASTAPNLHIESVETAEQAFRYFADNGSKARIDVLLLDYRLPGISVTDILKELCQVRGLDLPIILIIGRGDEEIARQSLKLGAADYVIKSEGYLRHLPTVIENVWLRAETSRREKVLLHERTRLSLATEAASIGIWEWNTATGEIVWDNRMYDIFGVPRGSPVTYEVWKSYIHPDDLPAQEAQLEKISAEDKRGQLDFRILRGHETVRYLHIAKAERWGTNCNEHRIVGTAIDITKRKQTELAIQQHARQQELIAAFGQQALASTCLDELWAQAAMSVSDGLDVPFSKALQLAPDSRSVILKAGVGWESGWIGRQISATYENTQNRFVLASHRPVIIGDFRSEVRFKPSDILKKHEIRSVVCVPISGAGGSYGILGAYSREVQRFTSSCFNFLQSLANILATAIDRKTTEERLTYLAQFDPLTGLPNRTLFLDRLRQSMEHAQR
ncbi:MAG: response regulator, partial [Betaproteobacteria bacterium]|nr:response regulator [Betaproteobacteria bacterium]